MAVAGIVAEYNPFHLGHAYHLAQTRAALGRDGAVVCVMSGHWVQRGECAAADKWTRSALALAGGADLVLELPTPWAMASAEAFARGAVGLLEATGVVDILSFGSEDGSLEALRQAADALDAPGYPARLREALGHGLSFPAARQTAGDRLLDALGLREEVGLDGAGHGASPLRPWGQRRTASAAASSPYSQNHSASARRLRRVVAGRPFHAHSSRDSGPGRNDSSCNAFMVSSFLASLISASSLGRTPS